MTTSTDVPELMKLPECDTKDPASLAAFYGPFGYGDHLRKIVLANCGEVIRAQYAERGEKISETRINDLAHTHDNYVEWIVANLRGRINYESDVLMRGIGA